MSTRQPSLLRKAISVLASFALVFAFVPIAWADTGGGTEGGGTSTETTPSLQFNTNDLADLAFSFKINDAGSVAVDGGRPETYNISVAVGNTVSVTVSAKTEAGRPFHELIDGIAVYEGEGENANTVQNATYSTSSSEGSNVPTKGTYTFTVSQNCVHVVKVNYKTGTGGEGNTQPAGPGTLTFDVHAAQAIAGSSANDGEIYYAIRSASDNSDFSWTSVKNENGDLCSVDFSAIGSLPKDPELFIKI